MGGPHKKVDKENKHFILQNNFLLVIEPLLRLKKTYCLRLLIWWISILLQNKNSLVKKLLKHLTLKNTDIQNDKSVFFNFSSLCVLFFFMLKVFILTNFFCSAISCPAIGYVTNIKSQTWRIEECILLLWAINKVLLMGKK